MTAIDLARRLDSIRAVFSVFADYGRKRNSTDWDGPGEGVGGSRWPVLTEGAGPRIAHHGERLGCGHF